MEENDFLIVLKIILRTIKKSFCFRSDNNPVINCICMITRALIQRLKVFFSSQPVEKAWLFGSFSRGEAKEKSDVDIIVRFNKGSRIGLSYFKMIDELERICARKVDLAEEDSIDPHVAATINQEKILIYERSY